MTLPEKRSSVEAAPILLAIDTATRRATLALARGAVILAEVAAEVVTHSERLLLLLDGMLDSAGVPLAAVDAFVCGRGPGSFTGVRIGLSTVKGLCLATGRPLYCVSSLLPLAAAATEGPAADGLLAVLLDARRGELFAALFRSGEPASPEVLRPAESLAPYLLSARRPGEPVWLAGDGALLYREPLLASLGEGAALAPGECHAIEARHLARAALPRVLRGDADDLAASVPIYLRPSDIRRRIN
jgi:tRNA threonylcarbamoyladenosine biosynthesis protein TsaB